MTKEEISNLIYEEVCYPSCDTCSSNDGTSFHCRYCNHYNCWAISREEADRIAEEILKSGKDQ